MIGRTAWIRRGLHAHRAQPWEAEELLHSLERKQLVQRVRRSSIDGEAEFNFTHALTRDVAYSQIRRADRAQKHEAAAEWIEQLAGERDDKAELLADHYQHALALRRALGEDTSQLVPRGPRSVRRGRPPGRGAVRPSRSGAALPRGARADSRRRHESRAPLCCWARPPRCSNPTPPTIALLQAAVEAQVAREALGGRRAGRADGIDVVREPTRSTPISATRTSARPPSTPSVYRRARRCAWSPPTRPTACIIGRTGRGGARAGVARCCQ